MDRNVAYTDDKPCISVSSLLY